MSIQLVQEDHYFLVAKRMLEGKVVPFLGAGANPLRPSRGPVVEGTHSGGQGPAGMSEGAGWPWSAAVIASSR